jgi:hypothetical protein
MAVSSAIALMAIKTSMDPRVGLARVLRRAGDALHARKPVGMFGRLGNQLDQVSEKGIARLQNSAEALTDTVGRVPIGVARDLDPVDVPFNAMEELPFAQDLSTFRSRLMQRLGLMKKPAPTLSDNLKARLGSLMDPETGLPLPSAINRSL